MRNANTDRIWDELNRAIHGGRFSVARRLSDDLLQPEHTPHLVDYVLTRSDIVRLFPKGHMTLLTPLFDRLELINDHVERNWEDEPTARISA